MGVDVATEKYYLISIAKSSWIETQQRKALLTGQTALPLPTDSELIADEPPLAQEIAALEVSNLSSGSNTSVGSTTGTGLSTSDASDGSISVAQSTPESIAAKNKQKINLIA
jgi:hypothetical protein